MLFNISLYNCLQTTIKMQSEHNNAKQNQKKIEVENQEQNDIEDEDSSSWSLASLEELKAMNLRDLVENQEPMEPHPKEKEPIQVKFPEKPTVLPNAPLHQVGKIIFIVGQLLIVESVGGAFVVDLQNWVCDENRNLFGFVIDVLGKVERPYYAIRPETITDFIPLLGMSIYYIEGSSKILRDEDIKSMKSKSALEAEEQEELSSDEENVRIERDFSEERIDRKKSPPRRTNKFRDHDRNEHHREEGSRERTRQNFRQNRQASRARNDQNQRYLNNMYSMHYNQMMRLYNGQFDPQNPPPMHNPYINQNRPQNNVMPHANIAQFGGNNYPNQFYGQVFPTNPNVQPQMGLFPIQQVQGQPQQQQQQPQQPQQGLFGSMQQNQQGPFNPNNPFNGRQ